jgi:hypothetical protein
MATPTGSIWYCELCQVEVWLAHQPKRQRCRYCRKWMTRLHEPTTRRGPPRRESCVPLIMVYPRTCSTDVNDFIGKICFPALAHGA